MRLNLKDYAWEVNAVFGMSDSETCIFQYLEIDRREENKITKDV